MGSWIEAASSRTLGEGVGVRARSDSISSRLKLLVPFITVAQQLRGCFVRSSTWDLAEAFGNVTVFTNGRLCVRVAAFSFCCSCCSSDVKRQACPKRVQGERDGEEGK